MCPPRAPVAACSARPAQGGRRPEGLSRPDAGLRYQRRGCRAGRGSPPQRRWAASRGTLVELRPAAAPRDPRVHVGLQWRACGAPSYLSRFAGRRRRTRDAQRRPRGPCGQRRRHDHRLSPHHAEAVWLPHAGSAYAPIGQVTQAPSPRCAEGRCGRLRRCPGAGGRRRYGSGAPRPCLTHCLHVLPLRITATATAAIAQRHDEPIRPAADTFYSKITRFCATAATYSQLTGEQGPKGPCRSPATAARPQRSARH